MAEAMTVRQPGAGLIRWVTLAAAMLLGACSTIVPRGPVSAPERPVAAPAPAPRDTYTGGIPRDTERNRVALLVPLSGSNGGIGRSIANATMLAVLDTRTEKVRVTNYDTATGAGAAARRAIAEGAQLILGPLLSDDVRAVAPIAKAAGVPVISFSNDVGVAGDGVYLLGYAPTQSIERVVGYAQSRGITNFAGLVPNGLYGQRSSTAFLRAVEDAGGRVVSLQTYPRGAGAIATAVARLNQQAPYGAVLVADGAAAAASAAPLVKRASPGVHLLGTELWNSETGIGVRTTLDGAWFASVPDTLYRQFAVKYRARFGAAPYRLSSLGYDAVLLTVRISRDWPVGRAFPEQRLRDKDGFAGIDGAFRFAGDGVADRALEVQEIRGGSTVLVSPAPTGFTR
ncbi:penicillin-binding protein activator [Sphingomonas oligophenolica]|uniref:Penicillin-binding protein activator n=1 Tax=Sphingomonas oligophenolica TaxID=301154 RepID=A0A502CMV7_9SPHN|nr:penicillin-binding protein activator [Sphingomonas oligophenolica]TPG13031.1 penicillin-binding protein activator [Sphingomonas oligophenolica]